MERNNRQLPDRRKNKRLNLLKLSLPVEITIENENLAIPGVLLDISINSIGLLIFKEIKSSTILNLSINLQNIKTDIIKSKVVWIKKIGETYRLGVEFINIKETDKNQIKKFIEEQIKKD